MLYLNGKLLLYTFKLCNEFAVNFNMVVLTREHYRPSYRQAARLQNLKQ